MRSKHQHIGATCCHGRPVKHDPGHRLRPLSRARQVLVPANALALGDGATGSTAGSEPANPGSNPGLRTRESSNGQDKGFWCPLSRFEPWLLNPPPSQGPMRCRQEAQGPSLTKRKPWVRIPPPQLADVAKRKGTAMVRQQPWVRIPPSALGRRAPLALSRSNHQVQPPRRSSLRNRPLVGEPNAPIQVGHRRAGVAELRPQV